MSDTLPLDVLLDTITRSPIGMPVRAMEQILAAGDAAIPAVCDALTWWHDDEERDLLWLLVLLGELRSPAGISPLLQQLTDPDPEAYAIAAAEALAKIGAAALPQLLDLIATGPELARLHAYAVLGWIADEDSYAALIGALRKDPPLASVVALALGDYGRREAIPALFEAYCACAPWQRVELRDTIQELHWGRRDPPLWQRDWRVRYRWQAAMGTFDIGWLGVCAILHKHAEAKEERVAIAPQSLDEILRNPPEPLSKSLICEDCGAPIEQPTGIPVCPDTAVGAALLQHSLLGKVRDGGLDDLFDVLNALEAWGAELEEAKTPRSRKARAHQEDARGEQEVLHQTCEWCIEHGAESIGAARALLLAETARLAEVYGDPQGLLQPAAAQPRSVAKVGRNDPCPCGSGRKYKRCCAPTS
jgi:hypothetical protein